MFCRACLEIFSIMILGSCMSLSDRLRNIYFGGQGERKDKVRQDKERIDELIMTALAKRNAKQGGKGCLRKLLFISSFIWQRQRIRGRWIRGRYLCGERSGLRKSLHFRPEMVVFVRDWPCHHGFMGDTGSAPLSSAKLPLHI